MLLALTACAGEDEPTPTPTVEAEESPAAGAEDAARTDEPAAATPDETSSTGPDETAGASSEQASTDSAEDASAESAAAPAESEAAEGGPAPYAAGEDPCAHLTAADLSEAVGREVVDTPTDEASELAKQFEDVDGDLIQCHFPTDDPRELMIHLNWLRLGVEMPEGMPEDIKTKHNRANHVNFATGQDNVQPVEVAGVPEAYSALEDALGSTHVKVYVPFDDALLIASLSGPEGSLDESDIPRAVRVAEVAISDPS